jgi:hypothetical protein
MVMTRYIDTEGRYYWKNIKDEKVESSNKENTIEPVIQETKEVKKKRKR